MSDLPPRDDFTPDCTVRPLKPILARSSLNDCRELGIIRGLKFVRIAVDWLLMSDIGEVLKKIVDAEKFPDYQIPKKTTGRKKRRR
jgi:hypothetical protein